MSASGSTRYSLPVLLAAMLGACTARLPADVEVVAVSAVESQDGAVPAALHSGEGQPVRLIEVAFTSRVNLVRFVTMHGYSLGVQADFCEGPPSMQPLVVSGIHWQGSELAPGGPDPVRRDGGRDSLLDYSFFLDGEKATAWPADICFVIAGGNDARGYRSNVVRIAQGDIFIALR